MVRPFLNTPAIAEKHLEEENKPEPTKEWTTKEIMARCKHGVVLVRQRNGHGSGFLVGRGLIVTNAHVVDGELVEYLKVEFPSLADRKAYDVRLLYKDRSRDIAVLKIRETPTTPLALAEQQPAEGESIVVIGSPGTSDRSMPVLENTPTQGNLGKQVTKDGIDWYHITAPINPGNSGGPVFDGQGKVIGIATWIYRDKQAQNFAAPLPAITDAVQRARQVDEAGEADRTSAEHDLNEVFQRLALVTALQSKAMAQYLKRMLEAEEAKKPYLEGAYQASSEIDAFVAGQNETIMKSFPPDVVLQVLVNRGLGARLRDDEEMHNLRKLSVEIKQAVDNPRYPPPSVYREKYLLWNQQRQRLMESLCSKLGVTRPQLIDRGRQFQIRLASGDVASLTDFLNKTTDY